MGDMNTALLLAMGYGGASGSGGRSGGTFKRFSSGTYMIAGPNEGLRLTLYTAATELTFSGVTVTPTESAGGAPKIYGYDDNNLYGQLDTLNYRAVASSAVSSCISCYAYGDIRPLSERFRVVPEDDEITSDHEIVIPIEGAYGVKSSSSATAKYLHRLEITEAVLRVHAENKITMKIRAQAAAARNVTVTDYVMVYGRSLFSIPRSFIDFADGYGPYA